MHRAAFFLLRGEAGHSEFRDGAGRSRGKILGAGHGSAYPRDRGVRNAPSLDILFKICQKSQILTLFTSIFLAVQEKVQKVTLSIS